MRTVALISGVTFVLIFLGLILMSKMLADAAAPPPAAPELTAEDHQAAERVFQDMALERDRIQREKESMLAMQQRMAVQQKAMQTTEAHLTEIIGQLQAQQASFTAERESSTQKLAKTYQAMKADRAAQILSGMDQDLVMAVLSGMSERAAAKILSYMDPGLAAQISTQMSMPTGSKGEG